MATYTTSALALGSHSIVAVYNGDSNHMGSTSTLLTQTIAPVPVLVSLASISISGLPSIKGGNSTTYTATAKYSDNTATAVLPTWSVAPTIYASISSSGLLTTATVATAQQIEVAATYTFNGTAKSDTKHVTITPAPNATPPAPTTTPTPSTPTPVSPTPPTTPTTALATSMTLDCASGSLYNSSFLGGNNGSVCLSMKKVKTPSGEEGLRGTASWSGFAASVNSAKGSTFSFAWENYENDPDSGILYENDPAHGALFILGYTFPSDNCSGGASFFAVVEALNAVSLTDLGNSITITPLFGQICGAQITSLTSYTLSK